MIEVRKKNQLSTSVPGMNTCYQLIVTKVYCTACRVIADAAAVAASFAAG